MIKADAVHIDSIYIYTMLPSKVVIYDKKSLKKIQTLKIKNASKIASDLGINKLIICTTKSTIMVYSLDKFELDYKVELISETFKLLYDNAIHCLYTSCLDLEKKENTLYKIDLINNKTLAVTIHELIFQNPIQIKENTIVFFGHLITENTSNKIFLREYDKTTLKLTNNIDKDSTLYNLEDLDSQWCYNVRDGFEDVYTNEVILYKNIGLKEKYYIIEKKVGNYYFITNYLNAYILTKEFEIKKVYKADDLNQSISDCCIDDDYIYLIRGPYLYIEENK